MKELITRVEELAVQAAGAQLQIDKSEAEARELGRELGKARQKMMELVNERNHALARVPTEAWLEENKKLADRIERMEASEDIIRKSLNEEITKRDRELREMDAEAKAHREALQAKDAEIGNLKATHVQDLSRIDYLLCEPEQAVRTLRDLEATANDNGRKPDEAVREFLTRIVSELMTADAKVRRIQKHAIICNANPEESVIDFMSRMKNTNADLKQRIAEADSAADKNGCHATEETAEFINRLAAELKNAKYAIVAAVTADRDRIRTKLAAMHAEANKSGRCNGDPVQLLKQGQADLDALTHFEKDNAKLDALVSQLQGELAEARAGQQKAEPEDMKAQLRDAKQDYEIVRVQLDRIAKTAKRCGRTDKESVIDFMNRQQREKGQVHSQCKQACEQLERIQKAANETHRCGLDPVALIRKGHFDHIKIVEFRKEVLRIQAEHDALVATHSAKEVDRLSALVASLQVELDDAKRKYGDIMAALGNETPLEFIDHMKRIGTEQKAALAAEVAELKQTITEKNEALGKIRSQLNAALATVANQSTAIAEAQRVTEKYTAACKAATKLKDWASTVRHKVLVKIVHDKAMQEYDNIIKELDGEAVANGS